MLRLPNPIKVFFKYQDDHEIERLSEQLEEVVQDLANTRSSRIIAYLNQLPILSAKAHTRPFDRKRSTCWQLFVSLLELFFISECGDLDCDLANDIKKLIVTNKLIVDEIDNIQQK